MFKKILSTLGSKILGATLSFLLIWVTTRFLTTADRGIISLFTANLTLIIMIFNILGGSGLVYLASRKNTFQLIGIAAVWSVFTSGFGTFILYFLGQTFTSHHFGLPFSFYPHLFFITFIYSFVALGTVICLGKEKIYQLNWLTLLPLILNSLVFCTFVVIFNSRDVFFYLYSLYAAYGISAVLSIYFLSKTIHQSSTEKWSAVFISQFKYGFNAQISNIIQFFNYRFSYFVIDYYTGKSSLGLYSVAMSISEAILMIASSMALVQYGRLVNNSDEKYAIRITNLLLKVSFLLTLVAVICVYFVPADLFVWIFKKEYFAIKPIVFILTIGIVFLSVSVIFAHYFGGKAMYKINTIGTSLSFAITIAGNLCFVPQFGIEGAAWVAVVAYFVLVLYQTLKYLQITNQSITFVLPSEQELILIRRIFSK